MSILTFSALNPGAIVKVSVKGHEEKVRVSGVSKSKDGSQTKVGFTKPEGSKIDIPGVKMTSAYAAANNSITFGGYTVVILSNAEVAQREEKQ
jgi:hypothetical protein